MDLLMKLVPSVSFKIWGGDKLKKIKNIEKEGKVGETWEISSHPSGPSLLEINKTPLSQLASLNYLYKYIDTTDNLSVQVHPDDDFAAVHENEKGKTECWLILDAEPESGIYLGFRPGVTRKEFRTALENGVSVEHFLNFYEVSPGDFFVVPAGAVHAIGKGVTLCEAQQNSGVTYRVWDWNRMGDDGRPRELHIEKAMEVMRFDDAFNKSLKDGFKKRAFSELGPQKLFKHKEFEVELVNIKAGETKELSVKSKDGLSLVKGEAEMDGSLYELYDSGIFMSDGLVQIKAKQDASIIYLMNK